MVERHQDYILVIPSIPAGQAAVNIPLNLDTDAPFMLRQRGLRVTPPVATRSQVQVRECRFRYTNQKGTYLAQQPIQTPQDFAFAFGQMGHYRPVYPQIAYAPGSTISVDLYNDSGVDITNAQVIFRGVKLYHDGANPNPTYPSPCRALSFDYQTGKGTATDGPIILDPTSSLYQIPLSIRNDADFVTRGGQAGLWTSDGGGLGYSTDGYTELYVTLMDQNLKPYSNIPIHIDWLFGNAGPGTASPGNEFGNAMPGLFFPEIYIPKSQALYFNLFRLDAPYAGVTDNLPVRLSMGWIGSKVYA